MRFFGRSKPERATSFNNGWALVFFFGTNSFACFLFSLNQAQLFSKVCYDARQAVHNFGHSSIIERVRPVGWFMIIPVAKRSGVGDHDGRIALLPERPVIGPAHARNPSRNRASFRWKLHGFPEGTNRISNQSAGGEIANKGDKVTFGRVK